MALPDIFFETERLTFRPFLFEDLDALHALTGDPLVSRYVGDGNPLDRVTTALWIERSRENVARFGYGTGAVVERATGNLVGWAGVARPEGEPEELVYGFSPGVWRRGYGTEIVRAWVTYAFETLSLTEVRATVAVGNDVSAHVLTKCGFVQISWEYDDESHLFVFSKPTE